ncbi:MAG: sigma-70 family RNA polymerase sigma factor [Acidimicrobiales bacterium]
MTILSTAPDRAGSTPPRSSPRTRSALADHELLVAMREGDRSAYGEIFRRHEPAIRRFSASLVPHAAVDDVVAETFASVLRAIAHGHGPTDEPIRYLMVTARSMAARHHLRQRRADLLHQRLGGDATEPGPEERLADPHVGEAFRSLPDRWRQAIWWREIEGLDPSEIGERFAIDAGAASALTYRARRALRSAYQLLDTA